MHLNKLFIVEWGTITIDYIVSNKNILRKKKSQLQSIILFICLSNI